MRNVDSSLLDYTSWLEVDIESLTINKRVRYIRLRQAIVARLEGVKYDDCRKKFSVCKSELIRHIKRCSEIHNDGRPWGFRALLDHKHVRKASMTKLLLRKKKTGGRDSFRILIDKHEEVFSEIRRRFLKQKISSGFHESRMPIKALHNLFVDLLDKAGVTQNDYPFNVDDMGYRSMCSYLKKVYQENIIAGAKARIGDDVARRLHSSMNEEIGKPRLYPFKRVLVDGHRLHSFMSVELPDLDGNGVITVINRPWLIILVDECSRAIIGYHLTLNSEYTQVDVMQAVKSALTPWKPKELTITGLQYNPNGGLPNGVIPELARAGWEEFWVDNAKANLANLVKDRLFALVGCDINAGPVNMPERRSVIERTFKTLNDCGFSRLPSTTGSGPRDGRRRNPEKKAAEYKIMLHEIEELLDVIIANYNATPNGGVLNGRSPLDHLSYYISKGGIVPVIPEERMMKFNFFSIKVSAVIRGGSSQGRAPHVNYQCVTYTNDLLRQSPFLVGETVTLVVDIEDLRQVKVYLSDGSEFGILTAHGSWGIRPHDLVTRKATNRLKNQGKLAYFETTDLLIAYERYKQAEQKKGNSLKNASRLESIRRKKALSRGTVTLGHSSLSDLKEEKISLPLKDVESTSLGFQSPPGGFVR